MICGIAYPKFRYMNYKFTLLFFVFIVAIGIARGQVSGVVTDKRNAKPLEGVTVFFDGDAPIAITNSAGQFELSSVASGFVTLVLYKDGYELYHSSMRIQDGKAYKLSLTLNQERKRDFEPVRQTFADDVQTGYRIVTYESPQTSNRMFTRFEPLAETNLQQQINWERKRQELYEGSLRHLLAALVNRVSESEGFEISNDNGVVPSQSLVKETGLKGYYRVSLDGMVDVKYRDQTSQLVAKEGLDVSQDGLLLNRDLLTVEGAMKTARLPISYIPFAGDVENVYQESIKRYYEKVYVHTDKPYYYQGEPMWFKAYLNYYDVTMRDSLSRLLYVELLSPLGEVVLESKLRIDQGMALGDFMLPDTIKRGDYFLRVYTNLQRNFGDQNLFSRRIPILDIKDKVDASQANGQMMSDGTLKVVPESDTFKSRQKISIKLELTDEEGQPIPAAVSVSVTDTQQVIPIGGHSITNDLRLPDEIQIPSQLRFEVDKGITLRGTYYNDRGNPQKTQLNLMQWKSDNVALLETADDGSFEVGGFNFYDSARIFYSTVTDSDEMEKGQVKIQVRERPDFSIGLLNLPSIKLVTTDLPQRIISEFEIPQDARVLDELVIRGEKTSGQSQYKSTYGRPDFVLEESNINKAYPNILYSLFG